MNLSYSHFSEKEIDEMIRSCDSAVLSELNAHGVSSIQYVKWAIEKAMHQTVTIVQWMIVVIITVLAMPITISMILASRGQSIGTILFVSVTIFFAMVLIGFFAKKIWRPVIFQNEQVVQYMKLGVLREMEISRVRSRTSREWGRMKIFLYGAEGQD